MPTGYTYKIENGEITTGKDFLMLCTRAFGIANELRDDPLSVPTPTKFELDPYYKKEYEERLQELQKAKGMTFREAKEEIISEYQKEREISQRGKIKNDELMKKYNKVKREVEEWIPPTKSHKSVKSLHWIKSICALKI